MRPWVEPSPVIVPPELRAAAGGHPLVAEALARRGVVNAAAARAFLDPAQYTPSSPDTLPGMARAVARIGRGLKTGESICVWGDFDVDGQTSTALLVSTLRDLGGRVTYHVPLRETEGHGIHLPVLEQAIANGARLIVTCDTGISAHDAVAFARSQRVDVVITDHHDLPDRLPDAAAILNPKLLTAPMGRDSSPLADLPGVGVAYKLAEALYERAGRAGEVEKHADLAALGIIADLALLRGTRVTWRKSAWPAYETGGGLACRRFSSPRSWTRATSGRSTSVSCWPRGLTRRAGWPTRALAWSC